MVNNAVGEHSMATNSKITNYNSMYMSDLRQTSLNTFLINMGTMTFNSTMTQTFDMTIFNLNRLVFAGSNSTVVTGNLTQNTAGSILIFSNCTAQFLQPISIMGGSLLIGGVLSSPSFTYGSADGKMQITSDLHVNGNFSTTNYGLVYMEVNGTGLGANYLFEVNGSVSMGCLLILKPNAGYLPTIGDRIQLMSFKTADTSKMNIKLFGAPYKNGKLISVGNIGFLDIEFSYGSVSTEGYKCHYLGNKKVSEMHHPRSLIPSWVQKVMKCTRTLSILQFLSVSLVKQNLIMRWTSARQIARL
jgi:hypothetical protein